MNGGPGWDTPPKPKPRPSRRARVFELVTQTQRETFKLLNRVIDDIESLLKSIWEGLVAAVLWIGHWLWVATMYCWLWFLWRRAREARALMNEALAECESLPEEGRGKADPLLAAGVLSATLNKYMGHDLRDRLLVHVPDLSYKLSQVGRSRRGRSIIAFYAATHGLFFILAMRVVLNW